LKAIRNGQTETGHFGKVGTFAAQKVPHGCVALIEEVHIFVGHNESSVFSFLYTLGTAMYYT
jgi:hypothetical protein